MSTCTIKPMDSKKSRKSNYFLDTVCKKFREEALSRHYKLKTPSPSQKASHVDFIMLGLSPSKTTLAVSLDVKCSQDNSSDKWQWLELRNSKGKPGWVYQEADFVVFETKKEFLLVNRKKLVNWLNTTNKVRYDLPVVKKPWQAKYRLYSRSEKKEVITQVKTSDLADIPGTQLWAKQNA